MPGPFIDRIIAIHARLNNLDDELIKNILDDLFILVNDNIAEDKILHKDLYKGIHQIIIDYPRLRRRILERLLSLGNKTEEIEDLIELINSFPVPKPENHKTKSNSDSLVNWITIIVVSISGLLGGVSVGLGSKEGLIVAIALLSLFLILYFLYLIIKWVRGNFYE